MLDNLRMALVITRREVRDQFRDWRIIFPVVALTVFFPGLMNFTAQQAVQFVQKYGAPIIALRLIPFLLMIVGFFPISVSLVIALESFVGEKERRSIEPLLCSPLSDAQLYLGKLLAAMVPPLLASFLGIGVYLVSVYLRVGWTPEPLLLIQILLLTIIQAVVMVSGAIVVSTQTTSVRAANLLASFIIIPMALLIQGESMIMFWARYNALWWVVVGLLLITGLLIRTGLAYFNREELLGRELDTLNFRWGWQTFKNAFVGQARSLFEWYRKEVLPSLWSLKMAALLIIPMFIVGFIAGWNQADAFPLPAKILTFEQLGKGFIEGLEAIRFFSPTGVGTVWLHNLRVVLIATILGIFSFGVLGVLILMFPLTLIGYVAGNVAATGGSVINFLLGLVLPHGVLEIAAMVLAAAAILHLGATLTTPAQGKTIGQAWLLALAKGGKIVIGLVLPLFLMAAMIEVFITPRIAVLVLGQ